MIVSNARAGPSIPGQCRIEETLHFPVAYGNLCVAVEEDPRRLLRAERALHRLGFLIDDRQQRAGRTLRSSPALLPVA